MTGTKFCQSPEIFKSATGDMSYRYGGRKLYAIHRDVQEAGNLGRKQSMDDGVRLPI